MEDFDVSYSLDNEQQFWDELDDIVTADCSSHQLIDNALRLFLHITTKFKDEYITDDYEFAKCLQRLLESDLFQSNKEYVRTQIVYSLLQEDEPTALHTIVGILLFDGRENDQTFERMNQEECFPRLVELIRTTTKENGHLHRLLLDLMYEMSRVQRLSVQDLNCVDDEFVQNLFQIIEELSDDVSDPYHYPVIRVILILNEQYMVASTIQSTDPDTDVLPPTNRVIKLLSLYGSSYMTFGENLILLLNRETETALQLLILKLLYLLFTTKATHEYFYTNDLRVLLDVIIRNLLDLPNELISLRHTYLRVMHPLLAYTQLSQPPYYKRQEITKVLHILGGSSNAHFAPADETTVRLVDRVAQVSWLKEDVLPETDVAKKLLGISLSDDHTSSSVSVVDVAAVMEKPGVQTPSRHAETISQSPGVAVQKSKPLPPPHGRHRRPAPAVPTIQLNGHLKKLPPKAPPRRRTKLKEIMAPVEGASLHEQSEVVPQ